MVTQKSLDDAFKALADPTRRVILAALGRGAEPVNEVAERFPKLSRPAVSKHLRILREAGLVQEERLGRQRVYSRVSGPLGAVRAWLASIGSGTVGRASEAADHRVPAGRPDDWRCW